jgi:hypothetical protein
VVAGTHGKGIYSINIPAGSGTDETEIPQLARLAQNVPNPFNPMTTISFSLQVGGPTRLTVFDVAGKRIKTLVDDDIEAGDHRVTWQGTDDSGRPVAAGDLSVPAGQRVGPASQTHDPGSIRRCERTACDFQPFRR